MSREGKIPPGLFKIWWYQNGVVKEEIGLLNPMPYKIAEWKKKTLARTTHRTGTLKIVPDHTKVTTLKIEF